MKNSVFSTSRRLKSLLILSSLIGLILAGCTQITSITKKFSTPETTAQINDNLVPFPSGKKITLGTVNSSKFVSNLLGPEYLNFPSHTDFYWTETPANDVMFEFNRRLSDANWQVETDWNHQNALILSTWKKMGLQLSILLFDDLDRVGIDSLARNYGISDPVPGSTMVVMHIVDKSTASP